MFLGRLAEHGGALAGALSAEEEDDEVEEVEEDELGTAAGRLFLFLRPFIRSFRDILGFPVQAMAKDLGRECSTKVVGFPLEDPAERLSIRREPSAFSGNSSL